ncbi:hypothetical protein [Salinactinospora qingdaonensis]|uniref:ARB-07466-like C-terminal domain-containing protein n=1 Tax=Salinactinospora qingdaonensis TaxID=702744 RepID=A0ABP7FH83_9ACTN
MEVRQLRGLMIGMLVTIAIVTLGGFVVVRELEKTGSSMVILPWDEECSVALGSGRVGLSREDARVATTAVALQARGAEAPPVTMIDPAVMRRLREGPSEDAGPSLACRASPAGDLAEQKMGESGLTERAERVRTAMTEVFGPQELGGFQPGGVSTGHGESSAHYDGRAIDIFFRPVNEENRRAGWLLAHWLVAHSEELHIDVIIFDDHIWSTSVSMAGWRPYNAPEPADEVLRHLDHVHVDVQKGTPRGH